MFGKIFTVGIPDGAEFFCRLLAEMVWRIRWIVLNLSWAHAAAATKSWQLAAKEVCNPYPGCRTPDVPKQLCPYTFLGEMCTLLTFAHANGLQKGSLVVEVGSAHGYGTWISRHYGHPFLGFECRKDEHARLSQQFSKDAGVDMRHACVSDYNGTTQLYESADSSSMSERIASGTSGTGVEGAEVVDVMRLDDVLSGRHERVGLIAIDVQGFEGNVLRGALQTIEKHRPWIFYEETIISPKKRAGILLYEILNQSQALAGAYECCLRNQPRSPKAPYGKLCTGRDCTCWPVTTHGADHLRTHCHEEQRKHDHQHATLHSI